MDLRGDRSLTLRYIPHNRAPLDRGRKEVLKHMHRLWGFDVMLEQQNEDGSVELLERCPPRMEICKWSSSFEEDSFAGCGVNALSGLQSIANSIHCKKNVGLISVAHQAIIRCHPSGRIIVPEWLNHPADFSASGAKSRHSCP